MMRGPAGPSDRTRSFPLRAAPVLAVLALLSACAGGVIPHPTGTPPSRPQAAKPVPSTPRPPVTPAQPAPVVAGGKALGAGLTPGPSVSDVIRHNDRTRAALSAFRASCPALMRRNDATGLTRGQDWATACAAFASWPLDSAADFFSRYFEAVQVGDG